MTEAAEQKNSATKVLTARFSALGDVAMCLPAIYSACRSNGNTQFLFLTRPAFTAIFVSPPPNLEVRGIDLNGDYAGVSGMRRLAAEICAAGKPDVFVDLHNVIRTKVLAFMLRLRGVPAVHLYKPRNERRKLLKGDRAREVKPQLQLYSEAFAKAGIDISTPFGGLYGGLRRADTALYSAITGPRCNSEIWIGIAPFAAHTGKIYPIAKSENVMQMLQGYADAHPELPVRVFLFGGGGEESRILASWAERYPSAKSLAGKKYGFAAELALFNHLDAVLTMDSGNMHLAALAGTPTVSIWGATSPLCGFAPLNFDADKAVGMPLSCRPCSTYGKTPCKYGSYACLNDIAPEVIYKRLLDTALTAYQYTEQ